jgi:hypothetical protein
MLSGPRQAQTLLRHSLGSLAPEGHSTTTIAHCLFGGRRLNQLKPASSRVVRDKIGRPQGRRQCEAEIREQGTDTSFRTISPCLSPISNG